MFSLEYNPEGVLVAKKDIFNDHHIMTSIPNLYVIKLMQSLKSRNFVEETFNWGWFYWYLTAAGIEFLRACLGLPEDIIPATLKQPKYVS